MIRSMTGYGRAAATPEGYQITFEIRSVNNRFLDVNVRLPRAYSYLEEKIRSRVKAVTTRGKIDAFLSVERCAGEGEELRCDMALAARYVEAMRVIARENGLKEEISVGTIAHFPDIFTRQTAEEDENAVWDLVSPVVDEALQNFTAMRVKEGENLYRDLSGRLDTLSRLRDRIEALSGEALKIHREKLESRLREYLQEIRIDESRLLTEVGILADKVDTGEELTRLSSHIDQFRGLLLQEAPAGKSLDFLTQELNREVNTTGSKCNLLEITNLVIESKNEIERIREQIQNVE